MERYRIIKEYLAGKQEGRAANRLERETLCDPFLYEAMEGLIDTPGDHLGSLIRLERQLNGLSVKPKKRAWIYSLIAVILLLGVVFLWIFIQKSSSKDDSVSIAKFQNKSKCVDEVKSEIPVLSEVMQNRQTKEDELLLAEEVNRGSLRDDTTTEHEHDGGDEIIVIEEEVVQQKEVGEIGEEDATDYKNTIESDVVNFNNYLKNVPFALDFIRENPEGEIILTFRINNKGVPSSMRVSEGFSKICNEEIIRLLEQGPKWRHSSQDRIDVKFIIRQTEKPARPEIKIELLSYE